MALLSTRYFPWKDNPYKSQIRPPYRAKISVNKTCVTHVPRIIVRVREWPVSRSIMFYNEKVKLKWKHFDYFLLTAFIYMEVPKRLGPTAPFSRRNHPFGPKRLTLISVYVNFARKTTDWQQSSVYTTELRKQRSPRK